MRYEVKCNSLGYNGHIYRKGEYVDLDSPEEAKRLLGYGTVLVDPVTVKKDTEPKADEKDTEPEPVKKVVEPLATADTSVIKTKKGGKRK